MATSSPSSRSNAEPNSTEHLVPPSTSLITTRWAVLPLALSAALSAWGQQTPDAGRILQEQQITPLLPHVPQIQTPVLPNTERTPKPSGGAQVRLQSVSFAGNTLFSDTVLQEVLGPVRGQSLDMSGLQMLANKITTFYAQAGYPLSYAYLPAQNLTAGSLRIQVVEARYGQIRAADGGALDKDVLPFLAPIQPGQLIESGALERTLRIFGELPGVTASSIMRTGAQPGTGDLIMQVKRDTSVKSELSMDNHGNRFTGEYGLRAGLQWDSPFTLGDQITAQGSVSNEQLWFGNLSYSLPLGVSGLRGRASYAKTSYQLAKDFASLNATGTAEIASVGLSYPLLRAQNADWTLLTTYERKQLNDHRGSVAVHEHKSVDALPIALQFDLRDRLAGGGVTFGNISVSYGQLNLDEILKSSDRVSGKNAQGHFNKLSLNVARLQSTGLDGVTLYGRIAAQWADSNLDSSEKLSLGGPHGVRAYPVGEGLGDQGWLAQLELRYAMGAFAPFAFYDAGHVQLNAKPSTLTPAVTHNERSIAGGGAGVRYNNGPWMADLALSWRTHGGTPEADPLRRQPRAWMRVSYRF